MSGNFRSAKEADVFSNDDDVFFDRLHDEVEHLERSEVSHYDGSGLSIDDVHKLTDDFYNPLPPAGSDDDPRYQTT